MTSITKKEKLTKIQKTFADSITIWREVRGSRNSPEGDQCSAAVRPPATIKARTINVVTNENFRSVLINFSPFYSHTKSDIEHFYTLECKNLPRFRVICAFNTSPFRKDQTKFDAYLISVPAIDPFLTFRVVSRRAAALMLGTG
jgi:hypothetical protein